MYLYFYPIYISNEQRLKLKRQVEKYKGNVDKFNDFILKLDRWLLDNSSRIIILFQRISQLQALMTSRRLALTAAATQALPPVPSSAPSEPGAAVSSMTHMSTPPVDPPSNTSQQLSGPQSSQITATGSQSQPPPEDAGTSSAAVLNSCLLTYEEFKLGILDLRPPCNKLELHILCLLLDPGGTGSVDYRCVINFYSTRSKTTVLHNSTAQLFHESVSNYHIYRDVAYGLDFTKQRLERTASELTAQYRPLSSFLPPPRPPSGKKKKKRGKKGKKGSKRGSVVESAVNAAPGSAAPGSETQSTVGQATEGGAAPGLAGAPTDGVQPPDAVAPTPKQKPLVGPVAAAVGRVFDCQYVRVLLRLIPFEHMPECPQHVTAIVSHETTVAGLSRLVEERACVYSEQLAFYRSKTRSRETRLSDLRATLVELGAKGGPLTNPPELTLYYDFQANDYNCSVLNAEYYFNRVPFVPDSTTASEYPLTERSARERRIARISARELLAALPPIPQDEKRAPRTNAPDPESASQASGAESAAEEGADPEADD